MKLTEMTLELAQDLMKWWMETEDSRIDEMKNPDVLYNMFFDGGQSQFYLIDDLLFIVTNINPGRSAVVYELGILGNDYNQKEAKDELIKIVRDYDLKRLTFACSSCVNAFAAKLKPLGFKYEGRMRHAAIYNGKLTDIDLYGFYSVKPSKRRRRGRRAKQESTLEVRNGASVAGSGAYDAQDRTPSRSRSLEGEVRA